MWSPLLCITFREFVQITAAVQAKCHRLALQQGKELLLKTMPNIPALNNSGTCCDRKVINNKVVHRLTKQLQYQP